jgi:hypothetical protein
VVIPHQISRIDSRTGAVQPVPAVSSAALAGLPEGVSSAHHATLANGRRAT